MTHRLRRDGTSATPPLVEKAVSADQRTYWLRNCQGFRVEQGGKKVGVVDDVMFGRQSEPATLIVRTGLFRLGLRAIPVDQIETIDPPKLGSPCGRQGRVALDHRARLKNRDTTAHSFTHGS
jgi:hypothetical protein